MDHKNIGDMQCAPMLYFPWLKKSCSEGDLSLGLEQFRKKYSDMKCAIILGGGGILSPHMMPHKITFLLSLGLPVIVWGAGVNDHGSKKIEYLDLSSCVMMGLRDYGSNYVPCVSCMSELFDNPIETKHEFVIYEHRDYPIEGPWPKMNNAASSFEKVIDFLGSGDIVITSSYHGVYWSLLLGKKVICHPFSSKFLGFKKPLDFDRVNTPPSGYLEECREINLKFYEKVRSYSVKL